MRPSAIEVYIARSYELGAAVKTAQFFHLIAIGVSGKVSQ